MTSTRKSIHGQWSSRLVFILAATGSAVGLGNIWKFPYIAGENGGGTFVLVYLVCIALIGIPIMMAEVMIGRRGRQSPINTMATLAREEKVSPHWKWLGGAGMLAGFLILVGSASFWVGRNDGGDLGFHAILLFSNYPVDIFGGVTRIFLYAVVPAGFVTSTPASSAISSGFGSRPSSALRLA